MSSRMRILCCTVVLILSVAPSQTRAARGQNNGFLVIAPREMHAVLDEFVDAKRERMPTEVVVLEEVLATTDGVDEPERLKRYLYDRWRQDGVRYVLLVGDADVLPARYMVLDRKTEAAFDYAFYPSDLYYADIAKADGSFDDWNSQREGFHARYFGEVRGEKNKNDAINYDGVDYRPELALGRWPVSTPEEASRLAAKTLRYERFVRAAQDAAPTAAFVMVGGWIDARPLMGRLADSMNGWKTHRLFYGHDGTGGIEAPEEARIVELINLGPSVIFHAGHGTDNVWHECFSTQTIKKLTNAEHPAVMLSAGCSTARFATLPPYEAYVDVEGVEHPGTNNGQVFEAPPPPPAPYQPGRFNPTGLGEQLLRSGPNGAVAYFGCNTGSQPCGLTLLAGFVGAMNDLNEPRLGDCWIGALNHYVDHEQLMELRPTDSWYPASIFFQGMKFMLFGDPTLPLPRAGESQMRTAEGLGAEDEGDGGW